MLAVSRNARLARNAQRFVVQARGAAHFENTVYNNMPFRYDTGKGWFAFKLIAYCGTGFAIPFIAAYVTLKRNGKV
ncbi:hypothetical protein EXIGLDRAFT_758296 [Exidia glandulosa HHB12029]|uniref:Cytochrome c oxidase subunit 8, mitochondrial n=1 Tax=Exidia glandulosa HHB12029 TaxID=1314781 RepID=A0A165QRN6_EXIGL|nr:hypothetical protein EXIGLDRAFT_758296 [Exidia glandulosa HHB12029]